MLKLIVSSAICLLVGCSGVTAMHPNVVQRNTETTPLVEFVGSDVSMGIVAASQNQMWLCDDCAVGATSGELLTALPLAIAKHPDIVHIMTGDYDVDASTFQGACGTNTCVNIQAMMQQLTAAEIPFVVGNVISWQAGTEANQLSIPAGGIAFVQGNIFDFDRNLNYALGGIDTPTPIIDYYHALTADLISSDGIHPTTAGYAKIVTMAETTIEPLHVGRLR